MLELEWRQTTARLYANGRNERKKNAEIRMCLMRFRAYSLDSIAYRVHRSWINECGRALLSHDHRETVPSTHTQARTRTCKFVKKMRNNFENKKVVSLRLPLHCVRLTNRLGIKPKSSSSHQVHWIIIIENRSEFELQKQIKKTKSCEQCTWLTQRIIKLFFFCCWNKSDYRIQLRITRWSA